MSTPAIKTVFVYPPSGRWYWMAFSEGNEREGPRGWGITEREAIRTLDDAPLCDPRHRADAKERSA